MVSGGTQSPRRFVTGGEELTSDLAALRIDRSRPAGPSRAARILLAAVLLAVLGAAGAAGYALLGDRLQTVLTIETDTVRVVTRGQGQALLTATGYLESRMQAAVGAKSPGRIAQLLVEEGARVQKGDLLAVLEHNDLDAALALREVAVRRAKADLLEAQNVLRQRERDYGREQALRVKGAGTEAALERAETDYEAAKAHVASLEAAVAAAEAQVKEAQEQIRNMHLYAPFSGTILSKDAELGETIMPGGMGLASGRGSVATLANLDALEVDTDVKEDYLAEIRRGQPAEVVVDAVPDRRYKGRLREIIPLGDRTRGIVKVKVEILDADERLFPELSATVHFLPQEEAAATGDARPVMLVAARTIATAQGQHFVWRVQGAQAFRIPIVPRADPKEDLVEIEPHDSLHGGDLLIVDPPAKLSNGTKVRPLK